MLHAKLNTLDDEFKHISAMKFCSCVFVCVFTSHMHCGVGAVCFYLFVCLLLKGILNCVRVTLMAFIPDLGRPQCYILIGSSSPKGKSICVHLCGGMLVGDISCCIGSDGCIRVTTKLNVRPTRPLDHKKQMRTIPHRERWFRRYWLKAKK